MADTTTEYGRFLRDALAFLIQTRSDNYRDEYGNDAPAEDVPPFHYVTYCTDAAEVLSLEGDTVTVAFFGSRTLTIEPTNEGLVVLVPNADTTPPTEEWQHFVADAIEMYVGFGLADFYFDGGSYGAIDTALRHIAASIEAGGLDCYEWADADDVRFIGDVQDDQDHAAVEYRLIQVEA